MRLGHYHQQNGTYVSFNVVVFARILTDRQTASQVSHKWADASTSHHSLTEGTRAEDKKKKKKRNLGEFIRSEKVTRLSDTISRQSAVLRTTRCCLRCIKQRQMCCCWYHHSACKFDFTSLKIQYATYYLLLLLLANVCRSSQSEALSSATDTSDRMDGWMINSRPK